MLGKRRRKEGGFYGSETILNQLSNGVDKKRIGIVSRGPVLRQGCKILEKTVPVGHITSGCPSPTRSCNIAMGYVQTRVGNKIDIEIRNKIITADIAKMPFVTCTYYK